MTGRMNRLLGIWKSWSVRRRAITIGVAAVAAAGLGVLAYELLKRPADVSNPDVEFVEQAVPKPSDPKDKTVDWPTYGFNDARTRYFPTRIVRPPFGNSDWSAHFGKLLEFSPIVVDDRIYMMDIESRFLALNAKTGKTIWERRVGKLNATSPAYSKGRLFATNLEPGQALALRAGDGKLLWRTPLPGRSESSPLAYQDKLVIFGCECGTVFALDQKSGKIKWTVETGGAIKGALAQGGGDVYGGNYAGEAFAIDAKTGRQEWRVNTIGGSFGRGGGIYSTPAVAFGRVYFGSIDSRVYSLDQDNGDIAWSQSTGAEVYSGPAVADPPDAPPTVYIGSADNNVYALNAETGDIRWQQSAGGQVTGAGSVIGNVAYFSVIGDAVGTLGYDVASGKKVFEHELGEYNPAITDGQRLYLTGYSTVRAFAPEEPGTKGKGKQAGKKKQAKNEG